MLFIIPTRKTLLVLLVNSSRCHTAKGVGHGPDQEEHETDDEVCPQGAEGVVFDAGMAGMEMVGQAACASTCDPAMMRQRDGVPRGQVVDGVGQQPHALDQRCSRCSAPSRSKDGAAAAAWAAAAPAPRARPETALASPQAAADHPQAALGRLIAQGGDAVRHARQPHDPSRHHAPAADLVEAAERRVPLGARRGVHDQRAALPACRPRPARPTNADKSRNCHTLWLKPMRMVGTAKPQKAEDQVVLAGAHPVAEPAPERGRGHG